jgi:hypothetical protein
VPSRKIDKATDELYGLPLAEFTKARDEVARRLRKEGKDDEADAVKALRKPTAAAWALNQVARQRPKDIKQLLATGKRLRKAHEALIGGGDRSALQAASAEERELIDSLAGDAATSATLEERIRDTLHAAALDEQTAAELAAGRLTHEREAVGFGGAPSAAAAPARRTAVKPPRPDAKRQALERDLASAKAEEQKTKREHDRSLNTVERAGARADEAQRRADGLRAALREAEQRERAAAKAADRAVRAVDAAKKKLG